MNSFSTTITWGIFYLLHHPEVRFLKKNKKLNITVVYTVYTLYTVYTVYTVLQEPLHIYADQGPHLRTPNPGFNQGFTPTFVV
jgi:hypothetical protein